MIFVQWNKNIYRLTLVRDSDFNLLDSCCFSLAKKEKNTAHAQLVREKQNTNPYYSFHKTQKREVFFIYSIEHYYNKQ
jgi:hypothetical protein